MLTPAAVNYAFIVIRNPTDADYYNGIFPITAPCDGTSVTGHGTVYPTTVRLVPNPPSDVDAIANLLESHAVNSTVVQAVRNYPWGALVGPAEYSLGTCGFVAYVPRVASHGSASIKLEIVPRWPGAHTSGTLGGKITTRIFNQGTHVDPGQPTRR